MRAVFRVLGAMGLVLAVGALWYVVSGHTTATVAGESMRPTYTPGERVLLERVEPGEVRRGDVVLHASPEWYGGLPAVRRVIGVGGDRIAQRPGEPVTLNGKPLAEPYVKDGDPSGTGTPEYDVTVPEGRLFLLGDHRANSNDSRYFLTDRSGTVPEDEVRARALDDRSGLVAAGLTALLGLVLVGGALATEIAGRRRLPVG
ncbi:signal peptidase I [Streptomyces sp. t39]|uniref:signal peptidase I n=1 Tax=Streptomyces sp. t39 TaxID=1828156 RepID=UPI0011CDF4FB|nr:signal peptidase I [Streptomyces sp. t39]TXS56562.1 signal peptidase I [Streptomyces sp. t39]